MLAVANQCRESTAIMKNLCSCFDEFLIVSSEQLLSSVTNQNEGMRGRAIFINIRDNGIGKKKRSGIFPTIVWVKKE